MARILVADDNSNVHKTVALALADLGAEILTVNNGEAAVRKLADFRPDLVLADIFMPVRSGYEVCEYVKKHARFSHVPVVLLVGAFDPFDTHESERVRADGILKKPFVPPDSLIAMVKELLERSLNAHAVLASVPAPTRTATTETGDETSPAAIHPGFAELSQESPAEDLPIAPTRMVFGENASPAAFEALLEVSSPELDDAFPDLAEAEVEPALPEFGGAAVPETHFWSEDPDRSTPAIPVTGSDAKTSAEIPVLHEPEQPSMAAEAELPAAMEPVELVSENRQEPEQLNEPDNMLPAVMDAALVQPELALSSEPELELDPAPELAAMPVELVEPSATLHPAAPPTASEKRAAPRELSSEFMPEAPSGDSQDTPEVNETVVTLISPRSDWTEIHAAIHRAPPSPTRDSQAEPVAPAIPMPQSPDDLAAATNPALVEVIVQRVMDKMRPQVVDIITTEFLRPLVQALVKHEVDKL